MIDRFLEKPAPEALSQAALEVLAIVAYEQLASQQQPQQQDPFDENAVPLKNVPTPVPNDALLACPGRPAQLADGEVTKQYISELLVVVRQALSWFPDFCAA